MARRDKYYDNLEGDETFWPIPERNVGRENRLVEVAKKYALKFTRRYDFLINEAAIILGHSTNEGSEPLIPVGLDVNNAVLHRYDERAKKDLAKRAVDNIRIGDERTYKNVLRRVEEDLENYGTRKEYLSLVSQVVRVLSQRKSE